MCKVKAFITYHSTSKAEPHMIAFVFVVTFRPQKAYIRCYGFTFNELLQLYCCYLLCISNMARMSVSEEETRIPTYTVNELVVPLLFIDGCWFAMGILIGN